MGVYVVLARWLTAYSLAGVSCQQCSAARQIWASFPCQILCSYKLSLELARALTCPRKFVRLNPICVDHLGHAPCKFARRPSVASRLKAHAVHCSGQAPQPKTEVSDSAKILICSVLGCWPLVGACKAKDILATVCRHFSDALPTVSDFLATFNDFFSDDLCF